MTANPKRTKRVLLIAGVAVAIAAGVGGAYAFRQRQLDDRARGFRDAGRAALAAGDYEGALNGLGRFLQRLEEEEGTARDLRDYAAALANVPQENDAQLHMAIGALRKALELDRSYRPAQDDLLALYEKTGFGTEALDLLDQMIAEHPGELDLVRKQRDWLEALRKFKEALVVAKKVNAGAPADFDGFVRTWNLLTRVDTAPTEVIDWIDSVVSTHPGDGRFEILRSAELERRNEHDAAQAILERYLAEPVDASDPKFVIFLVRRLDAADRFLDALGVLEKLSDGVDASLRMELCRRLYYMGRYEDLARRAEALTAGPAPDPEALALRITVLRSLGRGAEDGPVRAALEARDDATGLAWQAYVKHVVDGDGAGGKAEVDALKQATSAVPASALLHKALGDARARLGETDAAIRAWQAASGLAPSWASPLAAAALAQPASRGGEAMKLARAALARSPGSKEAVTAYVVVAARNATDVDPRQIETIVRGLDAIRAADPVESADLIPAQVGLVLRTDRDEAERRLREVLTAGTQASEATLLRLAGLADQAGLALAHEFLDLSETLHGITPQLALARALAKARGEGVDAGLRTLDELRARRAGGTTDLDWDLVRAGYLDAQNRPEAGAAWTTLSDAHADSLPAQLGALASPALWTNRDVASRVIDRVHALTGEDGTTWRIARARWLLSAPSVQDADVDAAAALLDRVAQIAPSNVTARVLYAQALERLGKLPRAQEQLLAAADLEPRNTWIALEIARIAQRAGDPDLAQRQLDRALQSPDMPPDQVERAAYLLAVRGDARRGADLLEPLASRAQVGREGLLLLAQLYAKLGKADRALDICRQLLDAPNADVVSLGADLLAATGRRQEADQMLARLDGLDLPKGDREAIRARFQLRWGTAEDTRAAYAQALAAAPGRTDLWNEFLSTLIAMGDAESLTKVLDDPHFAQVEPVQSLAALRAVCVAAIPDERLRPLLIAVLTDPSSRTALEEALDRVTAARTDPSKRADTVRAIRTLADANARVLPLQILSATLSAETGDYRGAADVASRAAAVFPDSAEAAFRAFDCLARSGRWDDALNAALKWRDRAPRGDLAPEIAVARVRLRLGRPVDAAAGLEPYADTARARPDATREFLVTYAAALVQAGKGVQASELFRSLAAVSAGWRTAALGLGPQWLGDTRSALEWLRLCASVVPEQDAEGRMQLARAWGAAWEVLKAPEFLTGARSVLTSLVARPDPVSADASLVLGTLLQQAGEVEAAREAYLATLAREPKSTSARNNLAMLLADTGKWEQAVEQAKLAIDVAPQRAQYHDTLAYALRAGRAFEPAIAASEEAVRLDPMNPAWLVGLAETQVAAGETAHALATQDRLRTLEAQGVPFTPGVRARFDRLRESK